MNTVGRGLNDLFHFDFDRQAHARGLRVVGRDGDVLLQLPALAADTDGENQFPFSPGFRTSGFTLATVQPQDGWGFLIFSSAVAEYSDT